MTILEEQTCKAIISMARKDEPDYWTKLYHQAAISAMSAFLIRGCQPEEIAQLSLELAGVMIEKLKNEK